MRQRRSIESPRIGERGNAGLRSAVGERYCARLRLWPDRAWLRPCLQGHRGRELRAGRPDDAGRIFRLPLHRHSRAQLLDRVCRCRRGDGAVRHAGGARGGASDPRLSAILHHHGDHWPRIFSALVVGMIWGTDDFKIETPFSQGVLRIGSLVLAYDKLSVIAATIILCALLYLFFNRTTLGTAMRASSENMLAAYYMGIPVKRVVSIVWAISAAVATCAGVLLAPITFIHSNVGLVLGLKAFPAAVLGGFGSIPGAVVGGVLIGVIESMAGFYLAQGWKDVAPYIVLLAVLLLKPEGIFGLHVRKKV